MQTTLSEQFKTELDDFTTSYSALIKMLFVLDDEFVLVAKGTGTQRALERIDVVRISKEIKAMYGEIRPIAATQKAGPAPRGYHIALRFDSTVVCRPFNGGYLVVIGEQGSAVHKLRTLPNQLILSLEKLIKDRH